MTSTENQDVIDMRVAEQLIAHKRMGQSAFERLVPVFLEEAQMLVEQLRCAIAASDFEGLRLTAHKLKGSASVIGAAQVRNLAQSMMADVDGGSLPAREQMQIVEQALQRFRVEADKLVGR